MESCAADLTLAWDPNSETDLAGYTLYYGSSSRNYPNSIDVGNVNAYTAQNLTEGQTYYFAATAYDTNGNESAFSEEIVYTIPASSLTHTIIASAGTGGTISPAGSLSVSGGSDHSFTISPSSGYSIEDVKVDGSSVGAVSSYTFTNIDKDHSIAATFSPVAAEVYTIAASAGANGAITPSGNVSVTSGGSQNFAMTADSGYQIADVVVNGNSVGAVSTYAFENVRSDQTIHVSFAALEVNQPAETPIGLYPEEGATAVSLTPLLEIAGYTDPDDGDIHGATHWRIASDSSFNQLVFEAICDSNDTNGYLLNVAVPPGVLFPNRVYYWSVQVRDDRDSNSLWSEWSAPKSFTTEGSVYSDANANGIPDNIEPDFSDLDGNGQNDNDQSLMRVFLKGDTLIGIKAVEGVRRFHYYNYLDSESLRDEPPPATLPYGMLNFNLELDRIGGTVVLEIYLPPEASELDRAYKYDTVNGWYEYPIQVTNAKHIIEITDGRTGDVDGVANGIIVDPIGISDSVSVSESIYSGCFIGAAGQKLKLNPYFDLLLSWFK